MFYVAESPQQRAHHNAETGPLQTICVAPGYSVFFFFVVTCSRSRVKAVFIAWWPLC